MDIKHLITILDKPKHDQVAWRRTLQLQALSGAKVEAISFDWNALAESSSGLDAHDRRKLRHALVEKRKDWLASLIAKASDVSPKVLGRTIWSHDIGGWVEDEAAKNCPDLVVKTVHKSGSAVHTSTDWTLLRTCPAPVLLTSKRRGKPSGNVVASLDLTHTDRGHRRLNSNVLEAARSFADLYNAKLHVVFAVEISEVLVDLDIISERASKKKIIEKATPELERLLKHYAVPKSRIHMPVGKVGLAVTQVARKLKADVLVVGSYSHRVKQLVGVGNSAERIVSKAVCDVLVVHP